MIPLLLLMILTMLITPPFEWTGHDKGPDTPQPTRQQITVRHRLNLIARPLFLLILLIAIRPVSDGFLPLPEGFPPLLAHLLTALLWGLFGLPIEAHFLAKRGIRLRELFKKEGRKEEVSG